MPAYRHVQQQLGLAALLVSLGVFFAAGMLAFVLVNPRYSALQQLPMVLVLSTLVLLGVAVCQQRALSLIRRERQAGFRLWLTAGLAMSLLFVALQGHGLWQLVQSVSHPGFAERAVASGLAVFVLVAVHAAHVLAGLVLLALVVLWAWQGRYDHESYGAVWLSTQYWHFLDVVWVLMLAIIFAVGR
jgi:cytochrome c oxidase subunit III